MEHWYVVTTKTGLDEQERAEESLLSQMIETYNPKVQVESIKRGLLTTAIEPIFPGYVFVKFDPAVKSAGSINSSRGVRSLITFGDVLVRAADGVIDKLKERLDDTEIILTNMPKQGEAVEIKDGPFAGLAAIFEEPNGIKRSFLMIALLGRKQQIEVDNTQFC